jgi:3-oxoacyl-[acyl-carrier-protein] synthase-3
VTTRAAAPPARPPVFLGAVGRALGDPRPIADLADRVPAEKLAHLRENGLEDYRLSDHAPWEMAAEAALACRAAAGDDAPAIDGVVYVSNSFPDLDAVDYAPSRFLDTVGLSRTALVGVGLNGCANLAVALRTAAAWIAAGEAETLMVVTTDRYADPAGTRLVGGGTSVFSDGAAACLVSARPLAQGWRLTGTALAIDAKMHAFDPVDDLLATLKGLADGVKAAADGLWARTGLAPDAVEVLVTNNYNASVLRTFAALSGVPFERVWRAGLPRIAHCFSADVLLGLDDLAAAGMTAPGGVVAAITSGHNFWGALALEAA